jgi:hypothetical protein
MRRLLVVLLSVSALLGGAAVVLAPAAPAIGAAPRLPDNPGLGLIYDGLRPAGPSSACAGAYESLIDPRYVDRINDALCSHGPDPAPDGVDVRQDRQPDPATEAAPAPGGTAAEGSGLGCYGTGSDGYRVQLMYARSATGSDRFPSYEASFRSWAARLDAVVNESAAETGGTRHVRFVTDGACNAVIERITLSSAALATFGTMQNEMRTKGYSRADRKYLVWTDANVYCGISEIQFDDRPDATPGVNRSNGYIGVRGTLGRVDNGCWGQTNMVEAHELVHLLGGVQTTAPNATPGYHCKDESDRLCYADGSAGAVMRQVCASAHERLYDCNHDDYFSTAPTPGSYLATHWNSASSAFLTGQSVVTTTTLPPTTLPPTTTTTVPPTTTTTVPPTTTTSTSTTTTSTSTSTTIPPTSTTTTAPAPTTTLPATTTTAPPSGSVPSAPQSLTARQPAVGGGVQLAWAAPATGPVDGYRIYRGSSPYSQTLLTTVGNVAGYNDATALPTIYYYRVTAYNAAGEGPSSPLTGMIGKAATAAGVVGQPADSRFVVSDQRLGVQWIRRWA